MRVLFDQGTPIPLRHALTSHDVETTYEREWSTLANGELLDTAEREGFDVFVTTDSNLKIQQNLESREIAIVILSTPSWPRIEQAIEFVVEAIDGVGAGGYVEVQIPWPGA